MISTFPCFPAKLVMVTLHIMALVGFVPACQPQCVNWDCLRDITVMPRLAIQLNVQMCCR